MKVLVVFEDKECTTAAPSNILQSKKGYDMLPILAKIRQRGRFDFHVRKIIIVQGLLHSVDWPTKNTGIIVNCRDDFDPTFRLGDLNNARELFFIAS